MNKKLILTICLLLPFLAISQQKKFFIEIGGNYYKSDIAELDDGTGFKKQTLVAPAFGYYISDKFSIGLQYQNIKINTSQSKLMMYGTIKNNLPILQPTVDFKTSDLKSNLFGLFARHYLKINTSNYNVFLNLAPSYFQSENTINKSYATQYIGDDNIVPNYYYGQIREKSIVGYDVKLGIGLSYRILKSMAIQYQLNSLVNGYYLENEDIIKNTIVKDSQITIFKKPLQNSTISINYQF